MKKSILIPLALLSPEAANAQQPESAGQPDWVEQAKTVAEMEGISVGEAIRRGNLERHLARQASKLETDSNYAGSEIVRNKKDYEIAHYFTDETASLGDADLDRASKFQKVRFSMREMRDFQKAASSILLTVDEYAYTSLKSATNRVQIYTTKPDEVRAALSQLESIPEFVEFQSGGWFTSNEAAMLPPSSCLASEKKRPLVKPPRS